MRRHLVLLPALVLAALGACIDMPGDEGEPCNDNGLCAAGLSCNPDTDTCEREGREVSCEDGATRNCSTNEGECQVGTESCVGGSWSGDCVGGVLPSEEVCDGLDTDCDGIDDADDLDATASCVSSERGDECLGALCHDSQASRCGYHLGIGPDDTRAGEMCLLAAGEYTLGPPPYDTEPVYFDPVYIDRFEVTNLRYQQYINALADAAEARPICDPGARTWNATEPYYEEHLEDHPVVCVTRQQAADFCAWAGKHLPYEEQWEAAARGTETLTYPWGEETPDQGDRANCLDEFCNDIWYEPGTCPDFEGSATRCADTAPIFGPGGQPTLSGGTSPSGLLHAAGNAAEWVINDTPGGGVVRGGSWYDGLEQLRTYAAEDVPADYAKMTVGFRCAISAYELPGSGE